MLKMTAPSDSPNYTAEDIRMEKDRNLVSFSADPRGSIRPLWFHFQLVNDGKDSLPETTQIVLKHVFTLHGSGEGSFHPVYRTNENSWTRLPAGDKIFRPDGRFDLSWILPTPHPEEAFEFAFSIPYGPAELEKLLAETGNFWKRETIGISGKGRELPRLYNSLGTKPDAGGGCYLLARQHAGEVSGSWVLDGVLRRLAEKRVSFPVWCVPFVDLDGVVEGDYGKDTYPRDFNRSWGPGAIMRAETHSVADDMVFWMNGVRKETSLSFDFHSPGSDETGVFSFIAETVPADASMRGIMKEIGERLAPYSQENFVLETSYKRYSAWGEFWSLKEFIDAELKIPFSSVETSYFEAGGKILTVEDYHCIGGRFADAIIDAIK